MNSWKVVPGIGICSTTTRKIRVGECKGSSCVKLVEYLPAIRSGIRDCSKASENGARAESESSMIPHQRFHEGEQR